MLLARSGLLPQELVDDWRAFQVRSAADNTFFGASNYYTGRRASQPPESDAGWSRQLAPDLVAR